MRAALAARDGSVTFKLLPRRRRPKKNCLLNCYAKEPVKFENKISPALFIYS